MVALGERLDSEVGEDRGQTIRHSAEVVRVASAAEREVDRPVERSDAGVASGLINTSRQVGGAIGLAAVSAIAATSTSHYAQGHSAATASSRVALDHGFQTGLYVLTGLLVIGALIAVALVKSAPALSAEASAVDGEAVALEEAA